MHDMLFETTGRFSDESAASVVEQVGADSDVFRACLARVTSADALKAADEAQTLGVFSSPTFFVGRATADGELRVEQACTGARSVEWFDRVLKRVISGQPLKPGGS
jgi:predicted DsbA family dithiol-disulfide isomerase